MKQRGWLVGALSLAVSHIGLLKQRGVQEQVKTLLSALVGSVCNILLDIERRSHFILGSTDIFDLFFKEVGGGGGGKERTSARLFDRADSLFNGEFNKVTIYDKVEV